SKLYMDNQFTLMLDNISPKADKSLAASKLYLSLIQMADSMFSASDFSNSVSFYEDAKMLESNYGFAQNKDELNDRIDSAKLGLLQSYLRIASRAVETGNEVLANSYKQKSNAFVSGHQQENLIGQLSEQSDELIQTYIRKAKENIDYHRYSQAIQLFESALASAKNFYNTKFNEQITNGLFIAYRNLFLELVKNAENYYAAGRSVDAKFALQQAINYREDHIVYLRTSNEASYLQNKMNENSSLSISMIDVQNAQNAQNQQVLVGNGLIDPNTNYDKSNEVFDKQTVEYARDLILQKASNAGIKVWGNALDEAWKIYDDAIALQKKYRLEADVEINNAFADLDAMIIERICLNNNFRVQDLMKEAKNKIALRNYENLSELLDEVIRVGTNNQGCDLNITEANDLNEKYYQFFQYQKDYAEILSKLFNYGLKSVIEAYINFDQNIDKYQLERYGYQHTTIKLFIEIQQNSIYTLQLIDYYIELINADAVIDYIQILKQQDFAKTETIEMQQKAGSLIAVSDHAQGLNEPEKRIEMIVGDDKRLSELKKVYLRSIKELQKNRPEFFKLFLKN
ncbi:MAG: hypothetical protein Q8T08_11390, partial [Ignavibacteria bacterium]|nr:hypothetical protein [Ignavibacteria bacterium]